MQFYKQKTKTSSACLDERGLAGFGLAFLPEDQAEFYILNKQLVRVLSDRGPRSPGVIFTIRIDSNPRQRLK